MKKFFKMFFLILFITIIVLAIVFYKRIMLSYRIADKYISLKNNVWTTQDFTMNKSSSSMNYKDVVYKNTNGVPLSLDIYGPINQVYKSSPVLIYVHGGSWAYGDKSIPEAISPILDTFREQGYTIISTSYELMRNKENFSKQISDVKDTIRWVYKNKSTYNLNTDEIGVIGVSSGAHLSLMASYSDNNEFMDDKDLSSYPSKVKYLIDFAGPTDLTLLNTTSLNYDLSKIFASITDKESVEKIYNPINYVDPANPNTLIIHSNSDAMVPYESSKNLYNKCIEVNAKAKLITLNSTAHDLSTISNDDIISISEGLLKFVIFNSPL
ncbi:alpha/beta hydrolase fold domain-containing protein [Clostridium chromiireducens]|uniref:Alpha/beta hydrolase fold domain-containing protein n=1 Tax=Clostridium chromiireducens TaxID=225345 RepID=A0A964RIG2_9CLOT|nr:alpha/beta hydrolase [Clostridium chromiireducens]MVX62277.1 alpha/beta hydrolase fold domain-containing protein [Clostridium chromiireducens]